MPAVVRTRRHLVDEQLTVGGEEKIHGEPTDVVQRRGDALRHADGEFRDTRCDAARLSHGVQDAVVMHVFADLGISPLSWKGSGDVLSAKHERHPKQQRGQ